MIKKWFYPHQHNDYHPYIIRPLGTGLITLLILLQPFIYNAVSAHQFKLVSYATDVTAVDLLTLSNQQRESAGAPALSDNTQLDNAAYAKAADMFAKDYWAHNSPSGVTPWDFIAASGYHYAAAAENLAMDFSTSTYVIDGWMNSPEHRTNLLNATYTNVGIAVINGTLTGEQTTLVVMELARPAVVAVPAPKVPVPTPTPSPISAPAASTLPAAIPTPAPAPSQTAAQSSKTAKTSETPTPAVVRTSVPQTAALPTKPVSMSLTSRLENVRSLNWSQWASILLLSTLLLANILTHTIVWRKQKRGWKHIWLRTHPALQASILLTALMIMIVSGYGVIV